jgi:D-alanine transaminase
MLDPNNKLSVYFNGQYLPPSQVAISPFDRGYLYADGVYEVIPVFKGKPFGLHEHLQRLDTSLESTNISKPQLNLDKIIMLLIQLNREHQGDDISVYIQVTRGATNTRDQIIPSNLQPQILAFTQVLDQAAINTMHRGINAIIMPDIRWGRCDIKSVSLLANVMLKQQAASQEALLVKDGYLTESTSSNVFIVKNNIIYTPEPSHKILAGITRAAIIKLAKNNNIALIEEEIVQQRLVDADEIWLTSSTKDIAPVITLNERAVGKGKIGDLYSTMLCLLQEYKHSNNLRLT